MGAIITVRTNARTFVQQLDTSWTHVCEKEMRGVISKITNTLRDQAKRNAVGVGLARSGPAQSPGGWKYTRHGMTPGKIYSYVMPNRGSQVLARATVDTSDWKNLKGAVFTEYGGRFSSPRPYLRPAVSAMDEGVAKAQKRFDEAIQRMMK